MSTDIASINIPESRHCSDPIVDYSKILHYFGVKYEPSEYNLQIGEITKTQGWILHLSVILSQISELLHTVIPFLIHEKVTFKIVMNESVGEDLLNGNLGFAQIGKIVRIYPEDDQRALNLAKQLIHLTAIFKGPAIPTDFCLGNIVYTRYGSFNPVLKADKSGIKEKFIYSISGQLIKDSNAIPFSFPDGINWPFKEIANPILPEFPHLFNRIYKIFEVLKPDPRGNVFKGLYVKSLFKIKNVVLKQGFSNSASDKNGRDIRDRLTWQAQLHNELSSALPLPVIYDLIQEKSYTLLIMEYINGDSLFQKIQDFNPLSKSWFDLSIPESLLFMHFAIEITRIIGEMHQKGYVHRDINPVNFLLNKKNKIFLIDIELAYSIRTKNPNPPFQLGTPGFMSPEQEAMLEPTIKQDIYSLGATLIFVFTGMTPIKFDAKDPRLLTTQLNFFVGNSQIAKLLATCLDSNPQFRPEIRDILLVLSDCQTKIQKGVNYDFNSTIHKPTDSQLKSTINSAINGLLKSPVIISGDLWYSKQLTKETFAPPRSKQYVISPGLSEGIVGPLYLIARLYKSGFNIDACRIPFIKGWDWIGSNHLVQISDLSPGLFNGTAGVALALAEGIRCGLLEKSTPNKENILKCFDRECERLDLSGGIAGQGISLLQCNDMLDEDVYLNLSSRIIDRLLLKQQKNGLWLNIRSGMYGTSGQIFNSGYDNAGIIWFLLDYVSRYPNKSVQLAAAKGLNGMLGNKNYITQFYDFIASKKSYDLGDGGKGMILTLIKSYQVLQDNIYKKLAEKCLSKYPKHIVTTNYTLNNGLAAMGELWLEAALVFKNEEWKSRADWIAGIFINTIIRDEDGFGHWKMEENNPPTADLGTGLSGIIHFLLRCLPSSKIGFPLLK